ncbi:translation initiation factor eIF2B subunit epsilon-like [Oratosquilla oratoria]|uniref:translation initiation factor eIF2B subunit epsilon-like n=1 Tax=Oratosquilla oratoria TaxID=337810 RepID=UPI003F76A1C7
MPPAVAGKMEEKQVLQAVVMAESFNQHFKPVTEDVAKVMLPLVNTPVLEYTLDWLNRSGVEDIILYCSSHAAALREHCQKWETRHSSSAMMVRVIASEDCHSLGDAMRDLYSKSVIKSDFFLLFGDVVANLDLKSLMEQHKSLCAKNKSAVMTAIYLPAENGGNSFEDRTTLITDANTNKILLHQRTGSSSKLKVPTEIIEGHPKLRIHHKVHDPHIAVCGEIIPSLFSDNFDYGTRDSLIKGLIEQEELLGYTVYCNVLPHGYASRITNFTMMEKVSFDLIQRQNYPVVCEASLGSRRLRYSHDPFYHNYFHTSAKFNKKSVGHMTVIGAGTEVSSSASINKSVIGNHCQVQADVKLEKAFIMDNVVLGNSCELKQCFLGTGVVLHSNVKVSEGCVIGPGVTLGPNVTIPPNTRLSANLPEDDFGEGDGEAKPDAKLCGAKGHGFVCEEDMHNEDLVPIWGQEVLSGEGEDEDDEDSEEDEDMDIDGDGNDSIQDEDEKRENEFESEVLDSLQTSLREGVNIDNTILEINGSRHAYNVSMDFVLSTITKSLFKMLDKEGEKELTGKELKIQIRPMLNKFKDLLAKYVQKPADQITMLNSMENLVAEQNRYLLVIEVAIHHLYDRLDILDDEVIVYWYNKGGAKTEAFPAIKKALAVLIKWLQQDDDDDE